MTTEEKTEARVGRRAGRKGRGREARLESRRAGTSGLVVRPGMPGGAYKPLADRDVERNVNTDQFVATLRRIADTLEGDESVRIQVKGKRFTIPKTASCSSPAWGPASSPPCWL